VSANEIIEQIRKLPREEQDEVFAFVRGLVESGALRDQPTVRYMDAGKARAVSAEVFSQRAGLFQKLAS
jgi:hypothetical protein